MTIADALAELSEYLELDGQSGRAAAYSRAAEGVRSTKHMPADPMEIDGVGVTVREDIAEYMHSGEIERLESLKEKHSYYGELRDVRGIGPSTAKALHEVGINGKADLEEAINTGEVLEARGVGERTAEKFMRYL